MISLVMHRLVGMCLERIIQIGYFKLHILYGTLVPPQTPITKYVLPLQFMEKSTKGTHFDLNELQYQMKPCNYSNNYV